MRRIHLLAADPFRTRFVSRMLDQAGFPTEIIIAPPAEPPEKDVVFVGDITAEWRESVSAADIIVTRLVKDNIYRLPARHCPLIFYGDERKIFDLLRSRRIDLSSHIRIDEVLPEAPAVLRAAVRTALKTSDSRVETQRWGIVGLAKAVGCSPRTLRRAAKKEGIEIKKLLQLIRVWKAIQLKRSGLESWERVALRVGYNSVSGLSELLLRNLGKRPSMIQTSNLERVENQVIKFVQQALSAE